MSGNNIHSITDFWDKSGLLSSNSSTCEGNPLHHEFDNKIENYRLKMKLWQIINRDRNMMKFYNAIDIGSGLGRFLLTLKNVAETVTALEPAPSLYDQLSQKWFCDNKITLENTTWEEHIFTQHKSYDLVLASGVLYLYDQPMLDSFFESLSKNLSQNGTFIAREFIVPLTIKLPSSYLPSGMCFYRDVDFWRNQALSHGLRLQSCMLAKPTLSFLRNKYISFILSVLRIEAFIWRSPLLYYLSKINASRVFSGFKRKYKKTCYLVFTH